MRILMILSAVVAVWWAAEPALGQQTSSMKIKIPRDETGWGGPMPGWVILEFKELNELLAPQGYKPFPAEGFFMMGGGGAGGRKTGWRFGGAGTGGDVTTERGDKIAKLSLSFGGFLAEYVLAAQSKYELTVGVLVGGSGAELRLLDHRSKDLQDAILHPPNVVLERGFFMVHPLAGVQFSLTQWLSVKFLGGYLWTFGENWKQAGKELPGASDTIKGWTLQLMLIFGS